MDAAVLKERLKSYAHLRSSLLIKQSEQTFILKEGNRFSTNPEGVYLKFQITIADSETVAVRRNSDLFDKIFGPLMTESLQDIIEYRRSRLESFLNGSGDVIKSFDMGYSGAIDLPFQMFKRSILAGLLNFFTLLILFSFCFLPIFSQLKENLTAKAHIITELGSLPLPSQGELNSLGFAGLFKSSIYFSFLFALTMSVLFTLSALVSKLFSGLSAVNIFIVLFCTIFFFISLHRFGKLSSLAVSLLGPILSVKIQQFIWLRGKIYQNQCGKLIKIISLITVLIIALLPIAFKGLSKRHKDLDLVYRMLEFRDDVGLSGRFLSPFAEFYYKYTLYSAEFKKLLYSTDEQAALSSQVSVLVYTQKEWVVKNLSDQWNFYVKRANSAEQFQQLIKNRGFDLIIADSENAADGVDKKRLIVLNNIEDIQTLRKKLESASMLNYKSANLGELDFISRIFAIIFAAFGVIVIPFALILFIAEWILSRIKQNAISIAFVFIILVVVLAGIVMLFGDRNTTMTGSVDELAAKSLNSGSQYKYIMEIEKRLRGGEELENLSVVDQWLKSEDVRTLYWTCAIISHSKLADKLPDLVMLLESDSVIVRYQAARIISELADKNLSQDFQKYLKERLKVAILSDCWYVGECAYIGYSALTSK
ncbi:MAG: hypothetical protein HY606_11930 [Planctomycetes bacterium]|nr:hypothetical protein [Planctomycetota bacterium]